MLGDFDSLQPALRRRLEEQGVALERHPRDKDRTDAELALRWCAGQGLSEVTLAGIWSGDRLDHVVANITLLRLGRALSLALTLIHGRQSLLLVDDERRLPGSKGGLLSLVPLDAPALVSLTGGVRWQLRWEPLEAGTSRGVSNELTGGQVEVVAHRGSLLVVTTAAPPAVAARRGS